MLDSSWYAAPAIHLLSHSLRDEVLQKSHVEANHNVMITMWSLGWDELEFLTPGWVYVEFLVRQTTYSTNAEFLTLESLWSIGKISFWNFRSSRFASRTRSRFFWIKILDYPVSRTMLSMSEKIERWRNRSRFGQQKCFNYTLLSNETKMLRGSIMYQRFLKSWALRHVESAQQGYT